MRKLRLGRERLTDLTPADLAGVAGGLGTLDRPSCDCTRRGCPVTGDPCLLTPPIALTTIVGCSS